MMKQTNILAALGASVVLAFSACDEVSESERYLPYTPAATAHCVLVEEFSGQNCVNCPGASEALENIQAARGADSVIVVSIHAGRLAISQEQASMLGLQGFQTAFGEQLYAKHVISAPPSSVVDRRSDVIQGSDGLLTPIVNNLAWQTNLQLSLQSDYDAATRKLTAYVYAQTSQGINGNVNVWLTECNIVSYQLFPDHQSTDHVFHNIFRASATSIDGEPVSIEYSDELQLIYTAEFTLDELWDAQNIHIVAFVEGSNGVEQTTTASVNMDDAQ